MRTATTQSHRSLINKYESFNKHSGEITASLRTLPGGLSLYEQAQAAEQALRHARQTWEVRSAAFDDLRARLDAARKTLLSLCRSIVSLTQAVGIGGADAVLLADAGDEESLARNLSDYAQRVPHAGPGLVTALDASRTEWQAVAQEARAASDALEQATWGYGEAYYRATAVIAQGKALLMASGVRVTEARTGGRKKKPRAVKTSPTPPAKVTTFQPAAPLAVA